MKRLPKPVLLLPWLLLLSACGGSDSTTSPAPDPDPVTDFREPEPLIAALAASMEARNIDVYSALLEEDPAGRGDVGFRYCPQAEDVDDFPWMTGDSWDLETELTMMGNMFDPDYVGPKAQPAVTSIEANLVVLNERDPGEGLIEIVTTADLLVLWGSNVGVSVDVRFIFTLAPDEDGFLRIREWQEEPLFRADDSSWSAVKNLYRT